MQTKVVYFRKKLLGWYRQNQRIFLWRQSGRTDYQIIIAEVLLQRTKAETVANHYDVFLEKFPSWEALATAEQQSLEKILQPLGLYKRRASSLNKLALSIVELGKVPTKRDEIDTLPAVGQYIANSIELLCFKKRKPLLDVNMARVLERFFGKRKLADIRYDPYLQNLAHRVVNSPNARDLNFAILDFAAAVCTARKPKCEICPLSKRCTFFLTQKTF